MIRAISGTVVEHSGNTVIIMTDGGVGYGVAVPTTLLATLGERLTLHTHLAVRETALDLYGFTKDSERFMFELLLTLPGVGPKSALQILNQADVTLLIDTIETVDPDRLTKQSGLSKKTAEKIIGGLKDNPSIIELKQVVPTSADTSQQNDVIETLLALGYSLPRIREVLSHLPATESTSKQVTEALRLLQ